MFHRTSTKSDRAIAGRRPARALVVVGSAMVVFLAAMAMGRAPAQDLEQQFNDGPVKEAGLGFLPPEAVAQPILNFLNRPGILDLEPAVAQAELILAVRLVDVTETKIVHGGRK